METKRRVLVFGDTQLLRRLKAVLRESPVLLIQGCGTWDEIAALGLFQPDVIIVDGGQITPEQFHKLLTATPSFQTALISIDPLTYQLSILFAPHHTHSLARIAQVIEILSLILSQPT